MILVRWEKPFSGLRGGLFSFAGSGVDPAAFIPNPKFSLLFSLGAGKKAGHDNTDVRPKNQAEKKPPVKHPDRLLGVGKAAQNRSPAPPNRKKALPQRSINIYAISPDTVVFGLFVYILMF